jgi:hypothetical protein
METIRVGNIIPESAGIHLSLRWSIPDRLISGQENEADSLFKIRKNAEKLSEKSSKKLLTAIGFGISIIT